MSTEVGMWDKVMSVAMSFPGVKVNRNGAIFPAKIYYFQIVTKLLGHYFSWRVYRRATTIHPPGSTGCMNEV